MARPLKCRRIGGLPQADYFKPRIVRIADLPEVHLTMDEAEAVRLADLFGLYQEEAANMGARAVQKFHEAGIKVFRAVPGTVSDIACLFSEGALEEITLANSCAHHDCR